MFEPKSGLVYVAEHSVKALQIALSGDSLGGGVDEHGRIPGYNISFNFARDAGIGAGHPCSEATSGTYLGLDGPHEGNHQGGCRAKFGGIATCPQLTAVNLNPHEQNHAKKTKHLPSVNGMTFDTYTFTTNLINELENASINRRTCDLAIRNAKAHNRYRVAACSADVWDTRALLFCIYLASDEVVRCVRQAAYYTPVPRPPLPDCTLFSVECWGGWGGSFGLANERRFGG